MYPMFTQKSRLIQLESTHLQKTNHRAQRDHEEPFFSGEKEFNYQKGFHIKHFKVAENPF